LESRLSLEAELQVLTNAARHRARRLTALAAEATGSKLTEAERLRVVGEIYYYLGQYIEAVKNFNAGLAMLPSAPLLTKLARAHIRQRNFALANEAAAKAAQMAPNDPEAQEMLGLSFLLLGKYDAAESALTAGAKGGSNNAQELLAVSLLNQGKVDAAKALMKAKAGTSVSVEDLLKEVRSWTERSPLIIFDGREKTL
jgi:tetratricopeptide (TPR) repeat protein